MKPKINIETPPEITAARRLIEAWVEEQGLKTWCMGGICSRNHYEALVDIKGAINWDFVVDL